MDCYDGFGNPHMDARSGWGISTETGAPMSCSTTLGTATGGWVPTAVPVAHCSGALRATHEERLAVSRLCRSKLLFSSSIHRQLHTVTVQ